jgi:hypothetical protein
MNGYCRKWLSLKVAIAEDGLAVLSRVVEVGVPDVVGGALALGLDEHGQVDEVLAVPGVEGLEEGQALALGVHVHLQLRAVLGGGLQKGER